MERGGPFGDHRPVCHHNSKERSDEKETEGPQKEVWREGGSKFKKGREIFGLKGYQNRPIQVPFPSHSLAHSPAQRASQFPLPQNPLEQPISFALRAQKNNSPLDHISSSHHHPYPSSPFHPFPSFPHLAEVNEFWRDALIRPNGRSVYRIRGVYRRVVFLQYGF